MISYKFRLYPTKEQTEKLDLSLDICRRTPIVEPTNESELLERASQANLFILNAFNSQPQYFVNYILDRNMTLIYVSFFDENKSRPAVYMYV